MSTSPMILQLITQESKHLNKKKNSKRILVVMVNQDVIRKTEFCQVLIELLRIWETIKKGNRKLEKKWTTIQM